MCGRFTLRTPSGVLVQQFLLDSAPELAPRFNIAPTQQVAAVRQTPEGAHRELVGLYWGLVPSWSKDTSGASRLINARSETVAEKPSFRAAFKRRRCLVLADGYYEWQATAGKHKRPYHIHMPEGRPFALAGIWESWGGAGGNAASPLESCALLTTEAGPFTRAIHDRMPVILDPADFEVWLDRTYDNVASLQNLLAPWPYELTATPVSTHVNNPRHEDPQCLEPGAESP